MTGKQYVEKVNPDMIFCIDDLVKMIPHKGAAISDGIRPVYDAMTKMWDKNLTTRIENYIIDGHMDTVSSILPCNTTALGWDSTVSSKKDAGIIADINDADDDSVNCCIHAYNDVAKYLLGKFYAKDSKGIIYLYTNHADNDQWLDATESIANAMSNYLDGWVSSRHTTYTVNLYDAEGGVILFTSPDAYVNFIRDGFAEICSQLRDRKSGFGQLIDSIFDRPHVCNMVAYDCGALYLALQAGKPTVKNNGDMKFGKVTISKDEIPINGKDLDPKDLTVPKKTDWSPVKFANWLLINLGYHMDLNGIPAESKFPNPRKVLRLTRDDSSYDGNGYLFYGTGEERRIAIERIIDFCMKWGNIQPPEVQYHAKGINRVTKKITVS